VVTHLLVAQDFKSEKTINDLLIALPTLLKTDREASISKINDALRLSERNGHYKFGQLCYWMGESLLSHARYDSAGQFYQKSIPYLEKEQDEAILGRAYIGAGYVLNFQTRFTEALAFDLKAEKIFRKLNDQRMLARSLKRIGDDVYYHDDSRAQEALPYYQESIAISQAEKDTLNSIRALNAIVSIYTETQEYARADAAMADAIRLGELIKCYRCLAISYSQWGINDHKQGKFESAIAKYKKEFEMNKRLGADYDQFFVFQNIAEALIGLKRYDEALTYSEQSLKIAQSDVSWKHHYDAYKARYQALKGKGDAAGALLAYEKQMQFRDSLFSEEKEKILGGLRTTYDLERKELQIADLEKQNIINELEATTARQWQIGLIVFLVLLSVVVAVLNNRYRLKQRTAKVLDEKNSELQKLNGFKDRMFAVISHDLRNPVNAFSMLMESLHQNVQHATKEELQEFLQSTLQSARDLQSLLNNLLEWALVQIGRLPYQPQAIKLSEVISESSSHVELMADQKKIKIANETNGEIIFADKAMITIVVRNILSNAIKFSEVSSCVNISVKESANTIKMAIRDQGMGMMPEELNKLFKQEESTQNIGNSLEKGAGIGLLLCKDLMDKNNGKISVESVQGEGSVFYLELPKH
jgi:signal transduction histidine kinase